MLLLRPALVGLYPPTSHLRAPCSISITTFLTWYRNHISPSSLYKLPEEKYESFISLCSEKKKCLQSLKNREGEWRHLLHVHFSRCKTTYNLAWVDKTRYILEACLRRLNLLNILKFFSHKICIGNGVKIDTLCLETWRHRAFGKLLKVWWNWAKRPVFVFMFKFSSGSQALPRVLNVS